jgi:zinc protease
MILDFRFAICDYSKKTIFAFLVLTFTFSSVFAQNELPPEPGSPRAITIPKITETKLANGLKIIVVERKNVPLVSVNLMLYAGASGEAKELAGLTDMTASLLTKGTKTRTATQIAEQTEFLGSGLGSGANWNTTNIGFQSTSDKVNAMMAIMADVVLNPTFPQSEIDLYKSQLLDSLTQRMTQPGSLASFVATRYTFGEHSVIGTPETIISINRDFLLEKYSNSYMPFTSEIIFTGDISSKNATVIAEKYFNIWKNPVRGSGNGPGSGMGTGRAYSIAEYRQAIIEKPTFNKLLVVDLPNSGQASVVYAKDMGNDRFGSVFKTNATRINENYFPASVANSLLGGGYSSRMNQEIRIKRGLSYGAGSSIAWRFGGGNFSTRCQTKTVSAAEVAELTIKEIDRLINESATEAELTPRKNVVTGDFGRSFETNDGISGQIQDLLTFGLDFNKLDSFAADTSKVTAEQVKDFALFNLKGGDIIIVGDYRDFKDDLAKRFPNQKIDVIKATELDLNSDSLRKAK